MSEFAGERICRRTTTRMFTVENNGMPMPSRLMSLCVLFSGLANVCAFADESVPAGVAASHFALPEPADVDKLLAFIAKVSEPSIEFQSQESANAYRRQAAVAAAAAAEKILAGKATDTQMLKAVEAKSKALQFLENQFPNGEHQTAEDFLVGLQCSERPAVAFAALRMRVTHHARQWRVLNDEEKHQLLADVGSVLRSMPAKAEHARLLTFLADVLGDTAEREQVVATVNLLRPHLKASLQAGGDAGLAKKVAALDGVVRRLELPGQTIAVEGLLLDGKPIDWQAYRGKVVLIDYWATWCGLCHAELPNLRMLHQTYGEQGFEVLGVSLDENQQQVQQFLTKHSIPWPTLFGHEKQSRGWNHPMVAKYGIFDLPRVILVDRDGRVVTTNARGPQLAAEVRRLFADTAKAEDASSEALVAKSEAR